MLDVGKEKAGGRVAAHQQVTAKVDKDLWPQLNEPATGEQSSSS
jgi:hypothetical protein